MRRGTSIPAVLLAAVVSFFMAWFGFVAIFATNNGFDGPSALGSTLTVVTCVGTGVVALVCVLRLWTSRVGDLGRDFATIPFVLVIVAAIWFLVSAFGGAGPRLRPGRPRGDRAARRPAVADPAGPAQCRRECPRGAEFLGGA